MKKILAMLVACAAMTCMFTACGNTAEEESADNKAAVEDQATETETDTEAETEAETETDGEAADAETEAETETETEAETEAETEGETEEETKDEADVETDKPAVANTGDLSQDILGMWMCYDEEIDDDLYMGFGFDANGTGSFLMDMSSGMHFTADGGFFVDDMTLASDYVELDGGTLSVSIEGEDLMTMEKLDTATGINGEYKLVSGVMYDELIPSLEEELGFEQNAEIYFIVEDETFIMVFDKMLDYRVDGNQIILTDKAGVFDFDDEEALDAVIEGNSLTLDDGFDVLVMERIG